MGGRRNFTILVVALCVVVIGAIAGIAIAVAGGGGSLASSYLANTNGATPGVAWFRFAPSGGTGYVVTAQLSEESGSPPDASVSTRTLTGTANLDGSTVVMNFPGRGTTTFLVKGGDLVHEGVSSSGSPTSISYHPATTAQWRRAIAHLSATLKNENAVAQAQQNVAQEQSSIQGAAQTVNTDMQTVNQDASTVNQDMAAFNGDYSTFQSDAQTLAQDQQDYSGPNFSCQSNWPNDFATLDSQRSTLGSDVSSMAPDLQTLSGDLATLAKDLKKYQSVEASDPGYTPHGAPTTASVEAGINSVGKEATGIVNTVNADASSANSTWNADNQAVMAAERTQSCVQYPTSSTIPTLPPFVYPNVPSSGAG